MVFKPLFYSINL